MMLRVSSVLLLSMISFISLSTETLARPTKSVTLSSSASLPEMCSSNNLNGYMNYIKKYSNNTTLVNFGQDMIFIQKIWNISHIIINIQIKVIVLV